MTSAPYDGVERRKPEAERWHIKREVQIGHIVTTLMMAISAGMYVTAIEKRVTLLEQVAQQQRERDERQDKAAAEAFAAVQIHLSKIDDKLDRLLLMQRTR